MPAQDFTNQLLIEVGGAKMPADVSALLVQGVIDDSRLDPDLFLVRFRDPENIVLEKAGISIGTELTFKASSNESDTPEKLLVGEVTALEKEYDGTGTFTVVRGLDKAHRLQRGRRVACYRQMTVSDVVRKTAEAAGLDTGRIDSTTTVHEQISQGNVSDWEFVRRLAADVGAEVAVGDGKLDFVRPAKADTAPATKARASQDPLVLELGRNLLRMRTLITSAAAVPDVDVRGWDMMHKRAVVGTAPAATTNAENGANPADLARLFKAPRLLVAEPPRQDQGEVDAAAKALADHVAGGFSELEGTLRGNPMVRAGTAVALVNVGKPFEGKYTVSASRHVFDAETGYTTTITVSGAQNRSLGGLVNGARAAHGESGVRGVTIAQVSDNNDPEKLGRVKLALPWLSDDYVTDWARTVQFGAGSRRGTMFVPEVGDEVLIAFEQGSFERPYVLGGLYNGVDRPPESDVELVDATSGTVNRRDIVSRTGHLLEFRESENGPRGVRVATGDGKLTVDLDEAATKVVVHSDGSVTIEARNGVTSGRRGRDARPCPVSGSRCPPRPE